MIKRFLLALAFAATLHPAFAQQPVDITADLFTVDENTQEAVFTGNVEVVHPTVDVWADKVVATYGDGGTSDIKTFVATGSVRLKTTDQDATGDRAVFTPADQLLRLTGNVHVTNSGGTVAAGELVVNLATNVSTFTSTGSSGRVTGTFTTQ
ncbi:MAG: lipopolysaccharide transport periplasmic protein LptA [Candidatus Devosia phytovorans]|uniref:Lipopolysaccharide transport periplasmic protein LptA n=1 Tax=Candidatus Devosia phytovorans TaxID=3121372 RepID=A0AAJ5VSC3_9HYPH|nr:lipopolysaccharide transport periplasmic protein LptA [Devosia sp.]WEK03928.1 MAG: lipopolysaccharide transport periplasmic protein LptA [Devosia sp.]